MLLGVASKLLAVAELSVKRMAANTTLSRAKVSMLGLFLPQCGTHVHCINATAALQSTQELGTLLQLLEMSNLHFFTMSLDPSLMTLSRLLVVMLMSFASILHAQQLE